VLQTRSTISAPELRSKAVIVDTLTQCRAACEDLAKLSKVAVDVEGINLCRDWEVCLIQVQHTIMCLHFDLWSPFFRPAAKEGTQSHSTVVRSPAQNTDWNSQHPG
jgi:hypothetical protein